MLNADSGFHTELAQLPDQVPLATVRDYENYLARLRQFPRVFDESIALLRRGLARGMTPPRVAIAGVDATAAAHAVASAEESVLYKPFADFPGDVLRRRPWTAAGGGAHGGGGVGTALLPALPRLPARRVSAAEPHDARCRRPARTVASTTATSSATSPLST